MFLDALLQTIFELDMSTAQLLKLVGHQHWMPVTFVVFGQPPSPFHVKLFDATLLY
jgi:hypothetical protein